MNKKNLLAIVAIIIVLTGCSRINDAESYMQESSVVEMEKEQAQPSSTAEIVYDDDDLVDVQEVIPNIYVELRYAGSNNFTGSTIYDFDTAYLRYATLVKLKKAQETLNESGYSLLIWDAYRPPYAQYKLWEIVPDARYVANPNQGGFSSHSRGNTVDVSIVTLRGDPIPVPTDFDDFSALADRNYNDLTEEPRNNALLLEQVMVQCGFVPYENEWWHFSDTDTFPVIEEQFNVKSSK